MTGWPATTGNGEKVSSAAWTATPPRTNVSRAEAAIRVVLLAKHFLDIISDSSMQA